MDTYQTHSKIVNRQNFDVCYCFLALKMAFFQFFAFFQISNAHNSKTINFREKSQEYFISNAHHSKTTNLREKSQEYFIV